MMKYSELISNSNIMILKKTILKESVIMKKDKLINNFLKAAKRYSIILKSGGNLCL